MGCGCNDKKPKIKTSSSTDLFKPTAKQNDTFKVTIEQQAYLDQQSALVEVQVQEQIKHLTGLLLAPETTDEVRQVATARIKELQDR
tara:strand:- start:64 stop:324 length:261 start_codon:yes stop_codon:yes gene_type:complete